MTLALTLPPELWLAIFDLILGNYTRPYDLIGHIPFPEILFHLRDPWENPPPIHPYLCRLRLVSRAFRDLLRYPYFLKKRLRSIIPTGTQAIYISRHDHRRDTRRRLQHIVMDPLACSRLNTLVIPHYEYRHRAAGQSAFDLLCDSASAFPVLRSLTFGFRDSVRIFYSKSSGGIERFWSRLNKAFPDLLCLTLRGALDLRMEQTESDIVTFKKLEILDMDIVRSTQTLRFPVLRHAAFGNVPSQTIGNFTAWRTLESLLIREGPLNLPPEWELLPQLQLLGVPLGVPPWPFAPNLPPPPRNHPVRHLYIYETGYIWREYSHEVRMAILKQITKKYPTIPLFTIVFDGFRGIIEFQTSQQAQLA